MVGGQFPCFTVDRNLGRLAKWLRLVGFDTQCEPANPIDEKFWEKADDRRVFLVRSRQLMKILASNDPLMVIPNDPIEQLQQVMHLFEFKFEDLKPFTRCTLCNLPLEIVKKSNIFGLVPDYVWQSQHAFKRCSGCLRIYWPGSHKERSIMRIKKILNTAADPTN